MGWTQDDVARTVRVSRAAVTSWETDTRRVPTHALRDLDFAFVAGGCLVDLVRAVASPQCYRDGAPAAAPRRSWGHVFLGEPGPAWAWVRPAGGDRVAGYSRMGLLGMHFDEVTGPDGIFLTTPYASSRLPLRLTLSEPGWVDFGRGTIPSWLDRPFRTSAGLADVEVVAAGHPIVGHYARRIRDLDQGDPGTLPERLRSLVGPERWDRLERQARRCPRPAGGPRRGAANDPQPPGTAEERMTLHRRLREARGMSQAGAAAAASALLARVGELGSARVTRQQVRNYEEGRASRVRYLPALLDMAYDAFGWSCREPVRVTRTGAGEFEADFPGWWVGPVGVTAIPSAAFPSPGCLTLTARNRRADCLLPGTDSRTPAADSRTPAADSRAPVTVEHLRMPDEPPLRLRVPAGWHLQAHMGHSAVAVDTDAMWYPVDDEAAGRLFELSVQTWLRLLGRTQADLDRVLKII
jgi:transcriptional regulator with XRE-family HTH domain